MLKSIVSLKLSFLSIYNICFGWEKKEINFFMRSYLEAQSCDQMAMSDEGLHWTL